MKPEEINLQRACARLVSREVLYCASNLICTLSSVELPEGADELTTLTMGKPDYEAAVSYFIANDADMDQLEEIVDESCEDWDDLVVAARDSLDGLKRPFNLVVVLDDEDEDEDEDEDQMWAATLAEAMVRAREKWPTASSIEITLDDSLDSLDDWLDNNPDLENAMRDKVDALVGDIDCEWLCREFQLDPDLREIYEHWIVTEWLADKLRDQGEVVEDFLGLTVWGRTTTGQSIAMDSVIEQIVNDLPRTHWFFREN